MTRSTRDVHSAFSVGGIECDQNKKDPGKIYSEFPWGVEPLSTH